MPDDTIQTTLIVIAIAVSLQTLLLFAMTVAAVIAWRRARQELGVRYEALTARVDVAVAQAQRAADAALAEAHRAAAAIDRVSVRASAVISHTGQVVSMVGALAAMPGHLVRALGGVAARGLLNRWRRGRLGTAA